MKDNKTSVFKISDYYKLEPETIRQLNQHDLKKTGVKTGVKLGKDSDLPNALAVIQSWLSQGIVANNLAQILNNFSQQLQHGRAESTELIKKKSEINTSWHDPNFAIISAGSAIAAGVVFFFYQNYFPDQLFIQIPVVACMMLVAWLLPQSVINIYNEANFRWNLFNSMENRELDTLVQQVEALQSHPSIKAN